MVTNYSDSIILVSGKDAERFYDKKDKEPVENQQEIVRQMREHLRKYGLEI